MTSESLTYDEIVRCLFCHRSAADCDAYPCAPSIEPDALRHAVPRRDAVAERRCRPACELGAAHAQALGIVLGGPLPRDRR